ncbi:hypothetical protein LXL04_026538 [Taraxacum kok-saghyz]
MLVDFFQVASLKKMQGGRGRGRGRGDPLFGFGGRDPFDDPFFTQPFGGMLQPTPFMGVPPFGSSLFGPSGSPFMDAHAPADYDHRQSIPNTSRGPIIEELNSDDEKEEPEAGNSITQYGNQYNVMQSTHSRPQAHGYTFQSSSVRYGGSNGAYYTSSTIRRAGSDGVRFEEHKEADSVSGEAAHRISRGIHDKGHTVSRHLKSDGHLDTMQTLHNINQDEVSGFEEAWNGRGGWAFNTRGGGRRRLGTREHAQSSKPNRP